jgi:lipopolysaccharide/colanic/teichoic acid biosynthesis glycosyltransferase
MAQQQEGVQSESGCKAFSQSPPQVSAPAVAGSGFAIISDAESHTDDCRQMAGIGDSSCEAGDSIGSSISDSSISDSVLIACLPVPIWKRSFDLIGSIVLLVALTPLFIAISLAILIVDGRPIFFSQKRLGLGGRHFIIHKFRTLKQSSRATDEHREYVALLASSAAPATKPNLADLAITGGRFLRSTSLDELPQLFNILRGDMSLIGPRPDVLMWEDYEPWQRRRFAVLPGVTGLWQVSGKNRLTFEEMIEKDIEYVENQSIQMDFRIATKTLLLILKQDNC